MVAPSVTLAGVSILASSDIHMFYLAWTNRHAKMAIVIFLLVVVITAGCVGPLDVDQGSGPVSQNSPTPTDLDSKSSSTHTKTDSTTPTHKQNEFICSGKAFNEVVKNGMEIHRTRFVDSNAYKNNSVKLTVGLYNNSQEFADGSILASSMDVTQAVATTVHARSTPNESMALDNGTKGLLHQPDKVVVDIQDTKGDHVGQFEITQVSLEPI